MFNSAVQARKGPAKATNSASPAPSNSSNGGSDLLKNLLMSERGRSPSSCSVVEAKSSSTAVSSSKFAPACASNSEPQIIVQFKKAAPSEPLLTASGSLFVYGASERRLRVVDWVRGWKCVIDRAQGAFVDISFSTEAAASEESTLAVLAEDGEVILGRIGTDEDAGELNFEAQASLSFPEIGRAAGLSWSGSSTGSSVISSRKHLAVYGRNSREVFFVHVQGSGPIISTKTSFISTRIDGIQGVSCIGALCFVAGEAGVEVFKWRGVSASFEAAEFVQFSAHADGRIFVFECPEQGIVIARIEGGSSIKFFSYREGDAQERSQLALPVGVVVDRAVFDANSRVLLCYSRGGIDIHAIRIGKLESPQLITSAFTATAGIFKMALSEAVADDESEGGIGFFAYLNDCIIQHSLPILPSAETEAVEREMDTETEVEAEDVLSDGSSLDGDASPQVTSIVTESSLQTPSVALNPEEIKFLVREAVMECVHESLAVLIHDALNASVQAGFDQIARDLKALIGELVRNVTGNGQGSSNMLSVPAHLPPSPSIQDIRELIAEGKAGEALMKAASVKDSRLLLEACRQLDDPFAAMDKDPLSQGTLVSLFKLLSADIDEDTELKLDWLQEVLIQIDLEEAIGESPNMLKDIGLLLSDLKELVGDSLVDGNLQKKMKTVMRLLRKFQMN